MTNSKWVLSALVLLFFGTTTTLSQSLSSYTVSGGAAMMSGGQYALVGTIGQVAIGPASDNETLVSAGYWYAVNGVPLGTAIEHDKINYDQPATFRLDQNYPNPFNPTTNIQYAVAENARVSIEVYNAVGARVRTLIDQDMSPGIYRTTWDAHNAAGDLMPSGIYIYRIKAGDYQATRSMVLLK